MWLACVVTILVTDLIVSAMLMIAFLRPIMDTLNMAGRFRSRAQANLKKTKWMTMGEHFLSCAFFFFGSMLTTATPTQPPTTTGGTTLAVCSSTLLCKCFHFCT
jgi:hypothetical protein